MVRTASLPTTRTGLESRGGKGILHIRDSLFEHVNKKGLSKVTWESPSNLNVLYKSFHVCRNMSRFWSFPLISFRPNLAVSLLTNGLTPHEVQQRWGGELSFHRSSGPGLLTEPFLSPLAGREVQSPSRWPLAPGIHTCHALCSAVLRQHSSRQSVGGAAGCCRPPTWSANFDIWSQDSCHIKRAKKKKAKFMEFEGISWSSLSHLPYGRLVQCEPRRAHWDPVNVEYEMEILGKPLTLGPMENKRGNVFLSSSDCMKIRPCLSFLSTEVCHHQDYLTPASKVTCCIDNLSLHLLLQHLYFKQLGLGWVAYSYIDMS